ncbi:MAG: aminopeptidase [Woeseia sp.]
MFSSHAIRARRQAISSAMVIAGLMLMTLLQGCYYLQAAHGQFGIWKKSQPLDVVINDPATDPALADRLRLLRDAREFASSRLLLPNNGSYQNYADLGRDYVLWNVVAAPEFSLEPRTWCYLIVGCLAYRGYFDEAKARQLGAKLQKESFDVYVGGVPAYSTLGHFNDPLLNTMMQRDDADLVALLFHELAHQRLYLKDETAFNESFASAVAEFGLQEWFAERGDAATGELWLARQRLAESRMDRIRDTREKLAALYAGSMPQAQMRASKAALIGELKTRLAADSADPSAWDGVAINNAWLATFALYRGYLPAFRQLFDDCAADWNCFYDAVNALGDLPADKRAQSLAEIASS